MPVKKPRINTASDAVGVAEELMDYVMLTGNEQLSEVSCLKHTTIYGKCLQEDLNSLTSLIFCPLTPL